MCKFRNHTITHDTYRNYCDIIEPFDRTNTAKAVFDEKIFYRIQSVIGQSYKRLADSNDLNSLFIEIPEEQYPSSVSHKPDAQAI